MGSEWLTSVGTSDEVLLRTRWEQHAQRTRLRQANKFMRNVDYSQVGDDVELIHPFDMYVLLNSTKNLEDVLVNTSDKRNIVVHYVEDGIDKSYDMMCEVLEYRGKKYVQTTTVRPKTHLFDHMDCACNGVKHKVGDHAKMDAENSSGAA